MSARLWRRAVSDLIHWFDYTVLSFPVLKELGGMCVLHGRCRLEPEAPILRGISHRGRIGDRLTHAQRQSGSRAR
jgi:hypothetical protein